MRAPLAFPLVLVLALLGGCAAEPPQLAQSVDPPRLEVPLAPKAPDGHRLKGAGVEDTVRSLLRRMFGAPIRVPTTPTDGYLMTYDSTTGTWDAEAPPSFSDVDTLGTVVARGATFASTIKPTVDTTYDIGDATHTVRNVYVGSSVNVGGTILTNSVLAGSAALTVSSGTTNLAVTAATNLNLTATNGSFTLATGSGSPSTRLTLNTTSLTSTLPLLGPDGSASAPAFAFSGDTNTGVWRPGIDILGLVTGGVESLRIDAGGQINLPSTSPVLWTDSTIAGTPDVGVRRNSAGTVLIDRGSANTFGDATLRGLLVMGSQGYMCGGGNWSTGCGLLAVNNVSATTNTGVVSPVGSYRQVASSTAANNTASWITATGNLFSADNLPHYALRFAVQDVAEVRFFAGFQSTNTATDYVNADDPATTRAVGLMFSTARPDTYFQWVEDDNATQTLTSTTVAPGVGTVYWLEIDVTAVNAFTMTLRNASWTSLSSRSVTTTPLVGTAAFWPCVAIRNLGSTDAKEVDLYNAAVVNRVGTP